MKARDQDLPAELAAALQDLRQIRQALDTARAHHPLRLVARPWLTFAALLGVIVVAFCVAAQLVLDHGVPSVLGLSPAGFVWTLGILLAILLQIVKLAVIDTASRRAGYDLIAVLRSLYTAEFLQVALPGSCTLLLGSVALHQLGGDAMILGFVIAGVGALVIPLLGMAALPEAAVVGVPLFLLGAASMFTFPEWPFYKLAVSWGGTLILGGLGLRSRFPVLSR